MPDETKQEELEKIKRDIENVDNSIVSLRNQRHQLVCDLHKAKLEMTIPSDEARKFAKGSRPIDDFFFRKLAEDKEAMQEIISAVLGVPVLVVSTIPQYVITNIGSRGVQLDNMSEIVFLAEIELLEDFEQWGKGTIVDIEVQRDNRGDSELRVFYNGASMVINRTPIGTDFKNIGRAIIIYISAFDVFGEGEMIYQTIKADKKTGKERTSPVAEFYVNLQNLNKHENDPDIRLNRISGIARIFRDPDRYDDRFPALSRRKKQLIETDEGVTEMSKEIQLYIDEKVKAETDEKLKQADEKVKRAEDEARQADEKVKRADEKVKQADEKVKQADEKVKQADEKDKRADEKVKQADEKVKQADEKVKRAEDEARQAKEDNKRAEDEARQAKEDSKRAQEEARQAKEKINRMEDIIRGVLKEVEGKFELSNQDIIDSLELTDDTQIKYVRMLLD